MPAEVKTLWIPETQENSAFKMKCIEEAASVYRATGHGVPDDIMRLAKQMYEWVSKKA